MASERIEKGIRKIVGRYRGDPGSLIPVLQRIQKKYGFISPKIIEILSKELRVSEHRIYGVATFYTQFRFTKPGKHLVKVCMGTACHVRGGEEIMGTAERELGVKHGETTKDSKFSLKRVACMGCCALSPVIAVDNDIYGKATPTKVKDILWKK